MSLEEEISDQIRHIEDRIIEVDTKEIKETKIMKEVGVGLEKDNIQKKLKGTAEAAAVGVDQV